MNTMFKKSLFFIASLFLLSQTSVVSAAQPVVGKSYYTAYNLMFEKGRHITTNYWRGELLPINSLVKVVSISKKKMVLDYKGFEIAVVNVPKHTKKTIEEVADKLLSTSQVSLGKRFAKDIKYGEMRLGMTKSEVIKTRGYPPAHQTYSTESDRWTYWSSRFVQMSLVFENGKLTRGRGLR